MVVLVVVVVLLIAMTVASLLGWTTDSRDTDFSVGPMIAPRPRRDRRAQAGTLPGDRPP